MVAATFDALGAEHQPIASAEAGERRSDEIGLKRSEPHESADPGAARSEREQSQGQYAT